MKSVELARAEGIKVGLIRPITLWPFPTKAVAEIGGRMKKILSVEMNAGQMIEDVKLAVGCKIPVEHYGRYGGVIPTPVEILDALKKMIK
jgi:2-oxoglutarate ferredoxin oxidoreductase subunit alpha